MFELVYDSPKPTEKNLALSARFWELANESTEVIIAVGYVGEASLIELLEYVRLNQDFRLTLFIGVQDRDGFTKPQLAALGQLNDLLKQTERGEVLVARGYDYHGKVYLFRANRNVEHAYVGSGNLDAIARDAQRTFEVGMLVQNGASRIEEYLLRSVLAAGKNFADLTFAPKRPNVEPVVGRFEGVEQASNELMAEINKSTPEATFEIPIKTNPNSNINAHFGKGRLQKKTGRVLPRPWYEVELIPGIRVASQPDYPDGGSSFEVVTDDGYKFRCKVSGGKDGKKNFRSEGSLTVLGAFLKGKLESAGIVNGRELITPRHLVEYGRDTLTFSYYDSVGTWLVDFSSPVKG